MVRKDAIPQILLGIRKATEILFITLQTVIHYKSHIVYVILSNSLQVTYVKKDVQCNLEYNKIYRYDTNNAIKSHKTLFSPVIKNRLYSYSLKGKRVVVQTDTTLMITI